MSRKLFALAMVAASFTLVVGTLEAGDDCCRPRYRNHDCGHVHHHQHRDCGHYQQVATHNCGHYRANTRDCGHYRAHTQTYSHQQVHHVATSTCCNVRPACAPAAPMSCATPSHTESYFENYEDAPAIERSSAPAPAPAPVPEN